MIFYSGWGLLVPLFGAAGLFAWAVVGRTIGGPLAGLTAVLAAVSGGACAVGLSWWVGIRLHALDRSRIAVDRKTGKHSRYPARHRFMSMPMQYYAFVYALLFGLVALGGLVLPQ